MEPVFPVDDRLKRVLRLSQMPREALYDIAQQQVSAEHPCALQGREVFFVVRKHLQM